MQYYWNGEMHRLFPPNGEQTYERQHVVNPDYLLQKNKKGGQRIEKKIREVFLSGGPVDSYSVSRAAGAASLWPISPPETKLLEAKMFRTPPKKNISTINLLAQIKCLERGICFHLP